MGRYYDTVGAAINAGKEAYGIGRQMKKDWTDADAASAAEGIKLDEVQGQMIETGPDGTEAPVRLPPSGFKVGDRTFDTREAAQAYVPEAQMQAMSSAYRKGGLMRDALEMERQAMGLAHLRQQQDLGKYQISSAKDADEQRNLIRTTMQEHRDLASRAASGDVDALKHVVSQMSKDPKLGGSAGIITDPNTGEQKIAVTKVANGKGETQVYALQDFAQQVGPDRINQLMGARMQDKLAQISPELYASMEALGLKRRETGVHERNAATQERNAATQERYREDQAPVLAAQAKNLLSSAGLHGVQASALADKLKTDKELRKHVADINEQYVPMVREAQAEIASAQTPEAQRSATLKYNAIVQGYALEVGRKSGALTIPGVGLPGGKTDKPFDLEKTVQAMTTAGLIPPKDPKETHDAYTARVAKTAVQFHEGLNGRGPQERSIPVMQDPREAAKAAVAPAVPSWQRNLDVPAAQDGPSAYKRPTLGTAVKGLFGPARRDY